MGFVQCTLTEMTARMATACPFTHVDNNSKVICHLITSMFDLYSLFLSISRPCSNILINLSTMFIMGFVQCTLNYQDSNQIVTASPFALVDTIYKVVFPISYMNYFNQCLGQIQLY